jgi:hypothetical protein
MKNNRDAGKSNKKKIDADAIIDSEYDANDNKNFNT